VRAMKVMATLVAIVGIAFASFFLFYGTKAGILERKILANFHGHYDTGQAALVRGIFYVILGLLFLGGSLVTWAVLIAKVRG
jgi:hypothetical protein